MFISRFSIKQQLFLIVAIIAFPAICIIISSGIQQKRAAIHDAKKETQKLAETIVSEQKSLVASTRQLFIALSQLPEVKSHNISDTQVILSEILRQSPHYSNIFIADSSGVIWVSAVEFAETVSVADRRYFKNALISGKLSSGEYHLARTSKKPTINLGYPLKDNNGKVTDVIVVGISLDFYQHIFDAYNLPKGASFALLDHKGIVLTRAIEPEKYMGTPSNPEIFKYMLEGQDEETSIGTSSITGDNRIQTYRKLRLEGESTPYMYVRAGIPTDIVMSNANVSLNKNLMIYSVSLMVAFLLSWFIGNKFLIDKILVLQRSSQRLADGDLSTKVAPEVGGGEIGQLAQAFDDMAQKLASRKQALLESKNNYRDIFNTTHDALLVVDEFGRMIEANRSSEIMFGYNCEEFLHLSIKDLTTGEPPDSIPETFIQIEKSLQERTQEFEWLIRRKNGESFWAEISFIPTSLNGVRRVLAVIRDITERKEMEQMKEAMLSNISHDMRTPLTAMLGFLEFVIEHKVGEEELKDYHVIMYKEGLRLNEMVTNFLDMQSLKANLHKYIFKPLDVKKVLEEVVGIFASPSAKRSINLAVTSDLPLILGDDELLHQAFSNLLSNAIKYSPEGSDVIIDAKFEENMVTLWVKDEGIGVPSESLDKIFDMFYRVQSSSSRRINGAGLGLALVKEVANAHNGKVWVESTLGQGSTFYMSLPVVKNDC